MCILNALILSSRLMFCQDLSVCIGRIEVYTECFVPPFQTDVLPEIVETDEGDRGSITSGLKEEEFCTSE